MKTAILPSTAVNLNRCAEPQRRPTPGEVSQLVYLYEFIGIYLNFQDGMLVKSPCTTSLTAPPVERLKPVSQRIHAATPLFLATADQICLRSRAASSRSLPRHNRRGGSNISYRRFYAATPGILPRVSLIFSLVSSRS